MKVLHITNWYHSKAAPFLVPYIKEHIMALNKFCDNVVVHLEIQDDNSYVWKEIKGNLSEWESFRITKTVKIPWRIKEWLSSRLLLTVLKEYRVNENYDVLNIHIAYPLCSQIKKILNYLKVPIVFTEHWTAFSFNFNLPENSTSLDRIRIIYQQNIPVLTVSNALADDIKQFSKAEKIDCVIVSNVVDEDIFHFEGIRAIKEPTFFMVNYWRSIKSPFVIFDAFKELLKNYPNAKLRVGGYGPLWNAMENYVSTNNLKEHIIMIGKLTKADIAKEMQGITSFVHAARHETFSIVTAEALMCGTPVVVSNIDCISEFVDNDNGILVDEGIENWVRALEKMIRINTDFDRKKISSITQSKFSKEAVGAKYYKGLSEIIGY